MLGRETDQERQAQKGFTLVELVIVMAVLVVLAAIAIPRYNGVLNESKVKSDAITAAGIVNAARIQETSSSDQVMTYQGINSNYFDTSRTPTSGGVFALSGGGNDPYVVTWTPNVGIYNTIEQRVTEGSVFTVTTGVVTP